MQNGQNMYLPFRQLSHHSFISRRPVVCVLPSKSLPSIRYIYLMIYSCLTQTKLSIWIERLIFAMDQLNISLFHTPLPTRSAPQNCSFRTTSQFHPRNRGKHVILCTKSRTAIFHPGSPELKKTS